MSVSGRVEIFLDKYRQLENLVKTEYDLGRNESAMNFLMHHKNFREMEIELDICRETRNLLSHSPKINGMYAVEPSDGMIGFLEEVIDKVEHPLRAQNVMIHKNELCYKCLNDSVREAIIDMKNLSYSHIPILEDGIVVGVFSEKIILSLLIDEVYAGISSSLTFADIRKYISIKSERADRYCFVSKDTLVSELGKMYKDTSEHREKIDLIFVTQTGNEKEKVQGIITAWELAAEVDDI